MQTNLPELQDTDLKYATALARLDQVGADLEHKRELSREAQRRATHAQQRVTAEREALTAAQRALTYALRDGKPLKALQEQVGGHQANLGGLETLLVEANNEAVERDRDIYKASAPINSAEADCRHARFMQLTVQLAKAIAPAIPISRELEKLSHGLGIGLSDSGYVFDHSRPQIGRFLVADDGSLSFWLR
jgi:hypothetical protein